VHGHLDKQWGSNLRGQGNQATYRLCSRKTGSPLTDAKHRQAPGKTGFIPQCCIHAYSKCAVADLIVSTLMCVQQHMRANSMENSLAAGLT